MTRGNITLASFFYSVSVKISKFLSKFAKANIANTKLFK